jgi:hypothetical protein
VDLLDRDEPVDRVSKCGDDVLEAPLTAARANDGSCGPGNKSSSRFHITSKNEPSADGVTADRVTPLSDTPIA